MAYFSELRLFERSLLSPLSATWHPGSRWLNNMRGNTVVLDSNSHSLQSFLAVRRFEKEEVSCAVILSGAFCVYANTIS